ncbi:MAG: major capsid protein, partial [Dehalococcoidia bacterium]|nr:major capsid protein [Dehalococcoidia bacterium]
EGNLMDEPIQIPSDFENLTDEALTELGLQIKERVEGLADEARADDVVLAEVETLISEFDRVNDALATREAAAVERDARLSAALERFGPAETEEVPEEEIVAEDAEVAAYDVADEEVPEDEKILVSAAIEPEAVVEAAIEVVVEAAVVQEIPEEGTQVATSSRPTVSRLRERRPEAVAPRVEVPTGASLTARGIGGAFNEGQRIDVTALAKAITDKRISMGNVPTGTYDKITLASAIADFGDDVVSRSELDNYATFARLTSRHASYSNESTALVAAGGVCAPLEPNYDFFRLAEEMNPVERCLPVAQAPRGGIRFIQPPDFRDAAPGVRVTTEAEDADGYTTSNPPLPPPATNSTEPKPCVRVACPPIQECRVDAVSRCVTFGNLNYRVFPEQVEAFLKDLSVIFTETKEIFYLDAIDANSTPVTHTPAYGAARGIVFDLTVAAARYRRCHHMAPTATLQVMLPSWIEELVEVDMVNDHALGLNFLGTDASMSFDRFLAQNNLDVCYYYDSATGAGQAFSACQVAGALDVFPSTVVSYLFAPGTFVRLDAGTLDLGIVRDSILNGTNDLQMFAEQWIQVCKVGLDSLRIESTLCPNGTAPEPVIPLVCPGGNT